MNFLKSIKSFLWDNKIIRNSILIFLIITFSYFLIKNSYNNFYNSIYNKGYNEAVLKTQKELDGKYLKAINDIKESNLKQFKTEQEKLKKSIEERNNINKKYNITIKELNDLKRKSTSNLTNKECTASQEEIDFFNNY